MQRRCRFCSRPFEPSRFHPEQAACSDPQCQKQRRRQNRLQKLARDPAYGQDCRHSAQKWRAEHPDYWRRYRAKRPEAVLRNRQQQHQRDARRRLARLANNNLAVDLTASISAVWWLAPRCGPPPELANNNSARAGLLILQGVAPPPVLLPTSCKQLPFGASTG